MQANENQRSLTVRTIDDEVSLVPYYEAYDITLPWYQDPVLCKQVDNDERPYSLETLKNMYTFLCAHGDCYYIVYRGELAGDITLRDNGEVCIVVAKPYQNRRIGRRCVCELVKAAREKGFAEVKANVYAFNSQSRSMFLAAGFVQTDEEWFTMTLAPGNARDHMPKIAEGGCGG